MAKPFPGVVGLPVGRFGPLIRDTWAGGGRLSRGPAVPSTKLDRVGTRGTSSPGPRVTTGLVFVADLLVLPLILPLGLLAVPELGGLAVDHHRIQRGHDEQRGRFA